MKILFRGTEYESISHNTAQVLHLIELQQQARTLIEGGLGMRGLAALEAEGRQYARDVAAWEAAQAVAEEAGTEFTDPPPAEPDSSLLFAGITLFLSRRHAGEKVTLVEALKFNPSELTLIRDDEPEVGEPPDPTVAGPAGPETPTGSGSD